jgi:hypothetical protein
MQTQLTFLREDSLANHLAPQGKEKARMMNATCGARCLEQYKKLNRDSSSLKMSLVSRTLMADWYSSRCALTWKLKGTKFNRLLFQLVPKTHRTEETDAGLLLPTPNAAEGYKSAKTYNPKSQMGSSLSAMSRSGMLPTPRVGGQEDYKTRNIRQGHQKAMSYLEANIQYQTGTTSHLNPRFVAEMMGFPHNWTELPFQSGEQNPSKATATQ